MAQRKKSEFEFIQDTFCPQVSVLCSYDAEMICRKNALTFVELVQPFCRFSGEIKISDPSNNLCTISNLRVEIKDMNSASVTPQPQIAKKLLDDMLAANSDSSKQHVSRQVSASNYHFVANTNTPWFESWRDCFVKIAPCYDHEYLKHFIACIFVVSTSHIDPLDQFQKLTLQQQQQQQQQQQFGLQRAPKWFFPNPANIYKYYLLLHDVQEGQVSKAHQIYENLKNVYGPSNCHLLQINSKSSSTAVSASVPVPQSLSMLAGTAPASESSSSIDSGVATSNILATESDPWLPYCKLNDLLYGTQSSAAGSELPESLAEAAGKDAAKFDSSSAISHPLLDLNGSSSGGGGGGELDGATMSSSSSLMTLNSSLTVKAPRHGMCLTLSDHERVRTFIGEFLQRGLVPYVERTIRLLNEQIQAKKSILKTLGLPRRIFGLSSTPSSSSRASPVVSMSASGVGLSSATSSGSIAASAGGQASPTVVTASASTPVNLMAGASNNMEELVLRRLADLAFMFRLYDLAYNSYHSCKKEFANHVSSSSTPADQLITMNFYLAGSLEMASIAHFMQNYSSLDISSMTSSASSHSLSSVSSQNSSSTTVGTTASSTTGSAIASTISNANSLLTNAILAKPYNSQYIEEAIHLYSNVCKHPYLQTRCILLSTEALRVNNLFMKAAYQFATINTTSLVANTVEDSFSSADMRNGLFLEQAAQCYLAIQTPQPMSRKYAFYLSLAGHRFNKAGQRRHALRVYQTALELYENRGWYKIQDYINFIMSRLCFNLKDLDGSLEHIEKILAKRKPICKSPSPKHGHGHDGAAAGGRGRIVEFSNETSVLKDFMIYSSQKALDDAAAGKPTPPPLPGLILPLIDPGSIKLNLQPADYSKLKFGTILLNEDFINSSTAAGGSGGTQARLNDSFSNQSLTDLEEEFASSGKETDELKKLWIDYEQELYMSAYNSPPPFPFRPQIHLFTSHTNNRQMPKAVVNEPIAIIFEIRNNLKISLNVYELTLLWKFVPDSELAGGSSGGSDALTNEFAKTPAETAKCVECSTLKELLLMPNEIYNIRLTFIPKRANGHLHVLGVKYRLSLANSVALAPPTTPSAATTPAQAALNTSAVSFISTNSSQLSSSAAANNSFSTASLNTSLTPLPGQETSVNNSSVSLADAAAQSTAAAPASSDPISLFGKQLFELRGPRLNNTTQELRSKVYDVDNRLNLKIVDRLPLLQIEVDSLPRRMICGQLEKVRVTFINLNDQAAISGIRVASNRLKSTHLCFDETSKSSINNAPYESAWLEKEYSCVNREDAAAANQLNVTGDEQTNEPLSAAETMINKYKKVRSSTVDLVYSLDGVVIKPSEHYAIDMWIKAPDTEGDHKFYLMFFYEEHNPDKPLAKPAAGKNLRYRIVRYKFTILASPSLNLISKKLINSQLKSNLLLNLEMTNLQLQTNFKLMDLVSLSDIWKVKPLLNKNPDHYLIAPNSASQRTPNVTSLVFKAQQAAAESSSSDSAVHIYRSAFDLSDPGWSSAPQQSEADNGRPSPHVLLHFIRSEFKKHELFANQKNNFVQFYFLWRANSSVNGSLIEMDPSFKYGLFHIDSLL